MKSITITGSKRESVGKVATKALRNAGMVPCVIYGGDKPVHFSAEEKAFKKLVYTPDVFTASINVDGQKIAAVLQDIQFHPVTDRILHVDFYQLFDDKEITMNIPVKLTGTSPGVLNGGSLRFTNRKLKVKALPANLPDFVSADISGLKIGSKLVISSLVTDGYAFMHPENTVVVQVRTSRNATAEDEVEEEATEAAAE
ncbi:LSU ribosomal protein L25P [Polaribacter sp. Hel1_33_78]|jgi:large subunit ribosomal protein L25|uniref:50S ribosomal protein L25/general stress protein Ctc n=1 Tax=unclassified Polaribacter TaxID=196858 RepID=UPI00052CABFB|nr:MULTISPECIES: 50S ribosomal protein L25/general stress protein Ctc [unclassified Polaribacter]KGL59177.1 LSU ribosomal protein L25p [Polaribacter sp. Hel1_33_49]PKV63658.1 LSU ribosomal protein L25P [Polaribacter sp. Hel1_33_96]SDU27264.1 LSU ribosomal protein L25P [Polaribacter sp. Hel1_33_78]